MCAYQQVDELDVGMYLMINKYTKAVHTAGISKRTLHAENDCIHNQNY